MTATHKETPMTDTFELTPDTPMIRLAAAPQPSAAAGDDASVAPSSSDAGACSVCESELPPGRRKFCSTRCKQRAYRAAAAATTTPTKAKAKKPASGKASSGPSTTDQAPAPTPAVPSSPSPSPTTRPASTVAGLVAELLELPAAPVLEIYIDGVRLVVLPSSIKQGGGGPSPADRP